MRDVIQKVLAAEKEAKQLVQAARAEAEQVLAHARTQAREIVEQAHREAGEAAEKILAAAETDAQREKAEQLSRFTAEIQKTICLDEATANQAVAAALRSLCGAQPLEKP